MIHIKRKTVLVSGSRQYIYLIYTGKIEEFNLIKQRLKPFAKFQAETVPDFLAGFYCQVYIIPEMLISDCLKRYLYPFRARPKRGGGAARRRELARYLKGRRGAKKPIRDKGLYVPTGRKRGRQAGSRARAVSALEAARKAIG